MGRGQNLGGSSARKLVGAIAPALQSRGDRAEADQLRRQHGLKTEAESRERVEPGNPESHGAKEKGRAVFIALPQSVHAGLSEDAWIDIRKEVYEAAAGDVGMEPVIADLNSGTTMREVVGKLQGADIFVADLTGLEPNVLYETGIAHGLRKPSALFSQDHDVEKLSDLAGYAVHSYKSREKTDRENARGLVRDLLQEISLNPEKPRDPVSEQLAHVSLTETGGGIGHRDGPLSWDRLVDGDPSYSAGFDALGNAQLQMESLLADGAGGYTYSTGAGSYLDDGALLLGHLGEHASASILPAFAANVAVEVQLSIRDFGPDETHWVGIQFRGFDFGVGRGYMVYLRATGQVEVQSPEGSDLVGGYRAVRTGPMGYFAGGHRGNPHACGSAGTGKAATAWFELRGAGPNGVAELLGGRRFSSGEGMASVGGSGPA